MAWMRGNNGKKNSAVLDPPPTSGTKTLIDDGSSVPEAAAPVTEDEPIVADEDATPGDSCTDAHRSGIRLLDGGGIVEDTQEHLVRDDVNVGGDEPDG